MIRFKEPRYSLNLNKVTVKASHELLQLDNAFVGTRDYMGIAYFWNCEYKHILRSNRKYWIKIHTAMLDLGLPVDGESPMHEAIIKKCIG